MRGAREIGPWTSASTPRRGSVASGLAVARTCRVRTAHARSYTNSPAPYPRPASPITSPDPACGLHPAQRLLGAETLVLRRASSDAHRSGAPARSTPNPHQIDAVVFALSRCRDGGCILAAHVGLGKTIETGLVIAQILAEGASRILLGAQTAARVEAGALPALRHRSQGRRATQGGFDGDGVFLIGREAAGSERGAAALLDARPFDLCVIDEVFARSRTAVPPSLRGQAMSGCLFSRDREAA